MDFNRNVLEIHFKKKVFETSLLVAASKAKYSTPGF